MTLSAPLPRKRCWRLTEHVAEDQPQQHYQRIWFALKMLWKLHLWFSGTAFQISSWPWIAWQQNLKVVTSTGWGNKWNTWASNLRVHWKEKPEHNIHVCSILWVNSLLSVQKVWNSLPSAHRVKISVRCSSVWWELAENSVTIQAWRKNLPSISPRALAHCYLWLRTAGSFSQSRHFKTSIWQNEKCSFNCFCWQQPLSLRPMSGLTALQADHVHDQMPKCIS